MLKLQYPGLNLFSYTLKQGLGVSEEQVRQPYQDYLGRLAAYLQDNLKAGLTEAKKRQFQDLGRELADLDFSGTLHSHKLEGLYNRRSIHDSYALLFNGYVDEIYEELEILKFVENLRELLGEIPMPERLREKQLGETWLISGVLVSGSEAEAEALAERLWEEIFGNNGEKPRRESGEFLGAKLFEFWGMSFREANFRGKSRHLLAIFYPDEAAAEAGARLYDSYFIRLLFYRHKITWAYENARELKPKLVATYNELSAIADFSRAKLSRLQRDMEALSNFTISLNHLEVQRQTIKTNLNNYKKTLDEISKKASATGQTDLNFMSEFAETIVREEYIKQIEAYEASLEPALAVLENLTARIRGIVEIRQARSDRAFQTVVGIVGVGLGTGGMVASASSSFVSEIEENPVLNPLIAKMPLPLEPGSELRLVLGFSIISGAAAGLVTAIIIFLWQQPWRR